MANPYGIEQVDVGGLLNMHAGLKSQRLKDLYMARELEMKERTQQREEQRMGALAKVFQPSEGAATPNAPSATSGVQTVPSAAPAQPLSQDEGNAIIARASQAKTITPVEADRVRRSLGPQGTAAYDKWMADNGITIEGQGGPEAASPALPPLDQDLPARTDGMKINQEALRELYALDPDMAQKIQKAVYDADEQSLKAMTRRGEAMANVAMRLQSVPASERPAELQRWGQYLVDSGLPAQALQQADLTDAGLSRYVQQGRKIENIISDERTDEKDAEARRRWGIQDARAARAEGRATVRFEERDKDRAALAASGGGGISSDISDLNY